MDVVDYTPRRNEAEDTWSIGEAKITGDALRALASEPDKEKCIRWLHSKGLDEYQIEVALNLSESDEVQLAYEPGDGEA